MVNNRATRMDRVFAALADSTRRGMIARLSLGPASIGELGRPHPISKPAVTKHIKILERAGLIERRKDGRFHHCELRPEPLQDAEEWIEKHRVFWEQSLDSLARYLEETQDEERKS